MVTPGDRDPYFGRFAFTVVTIALVVIILGLAGIWYFFQAGGTTSPSNPLSGLFRPGGNLPPDKIMLYYTKDGRQLVGTVANLGSAGLSPAAKAEEIVRRLAAGRDADFLRSPIPPGTQVLSVFMHDDIVIVNLSKEFMTNLQGGVDAELLAVYSIVNSLLSNLESADAVQILIDNEKLPTLKGSVEIESPLIANKAVIRAL